MKSKPDICVKAIKILAAESKHWLNWEDLNQGLPKCFTSSQLKELKHNVYHGPVIQPFV